jgi:DNA uptake protein ComE-like DNA-binding protein
MKYNTNTMEQVAKTFSRLIDLNIATENELNLITGVNGYSIDTLNSVIYYKTGYRDLEQYEEAEL